MSDPFVSSVARGLTALRPPDRVLIAVSGGADSVALLDALVRSHKRRELKHVTYVVGHFDHALRPDSALDAELVERLARERNLPALVRRRTQELSLALSLEHGAREARYAALVGMARESGCAAIVTGHTATDQVETMLWRLVRGTGGRGLGAMRGDRELERLRLLRPLLGLTREDTRAYCVSRALAFRDDPTNENELPRARLRAEVVPVLERLQPGAVQRMAAAAQRLQEDEDFLETLAAPLIEGPPETLLDRLRAAPRPLRLRALMRWAAEGLGSREGLSAVHVEALEALVMRGQGEVELPASQATRRVTTLLHKVLVLEARPRVKQQGVESAADKHQLQATDDPR